MFMLSPQSAAVAEGLVLSTSLRKYLLGVYSGGIFKLPETMHEVLTPPYKPGVAGVKMWRICAAQTWGTAWPQLSLGSGGAHEHFGNRRIVPAPSVLRVNSSYWHGGLELSAPAPGRLSLCLSIWTPVD